MELRHLRILLAVVEEEHFGRAADRLGIAQSTVSHAIAELEREVGSRLIERTSRRFAVTANGHYLVAEARVALQSLDRAVQVIRTNAQSARRVLKVGANYPNGKLTVPRLAAHFREHQPTVALTVSALGSAAQEQALLLGDLDLALLYGPVASADLESELVETVRLAALVGPDHPLATEETVALATAARYPWVIGGAGMHRAIRTTVLEAVDRAGVDLPQVNEPSDDLYLHLATTHDIAFVSEPRCEQGVASGMAKLFVSPSPRLLELHVAHRKSPGDPMVNEARNVLVNRCSRARHFP